MLDISKCTGPIDDMRDDVTLEVVEVNSESAGCRRGCIGVEMNVSEDPLTGLYFLPPEVTVYIAIR